MPFSVHTINVGPVRGPVVMNEKKEIVAGPFLDKAEAHAVKRRLSLQEKARQRQEK